MKINEVKYGFKLVSEKEIKDHSAVLYEYEHLKSGGKVAYLACEDTNCCFAVGFRTVPEDSTGVCHIIEHSVLCGSEKYPLKEPFVNLIKGSMATFLNALTASDWTLYPVASQTPKDFDNLMSIYCDAVFRPLSVIDEKAFLQEGWHLELMNESDMPSYKGVVYNEMKGAMSNVERILGQTAQETMYKDNTYHFNSGGDPDVIPELTYEAYKDFYHRHYTPQNALTYFYGKLDIEEKLRFLDEEYFKGYDKQDVEIVIEKQEPFIDLNYEKEYEVGPNDDVENNVYMSLCYEIAGFDKTEEYLAMSILNDALLSTNDSPLKKALLAAKLGQNVEAAIDEDNIQPAIYINLIKTNKNKKEAFRNVFISEVQKLVDAGLDKELLLASLNHFEFANKEMNVGGMPKGLVLLFNLMAAFNYRLPLADTLESNKVFKVLREKIQTNYFEELLRKYFLESKHYVQVVVKPSKTLGAEKLAKMNALMSETKANMSADDVKKLVKQTHDLLAYQGKKDTKKELATLPRLGLKDIPMDVNFLGHKKCKIKGMETVVRELNTNSIGYLRLYFDEKVVTYDELPYVKILSKLLGDLPTKSYSAIELNKQVKTYLGNLAFDTVIKGISKDECVTKLVLSASALNENIEHLSRIINEVLYSKFNAKDVKQILLQLVNETRMMIIGRGNACAMDMARSAYSLEGAYLVQGSTGPKFFKIINDMAKNFDGKVVIAKLKEIAKKLFTRSNTLVSIAGDAETIEKLKVQVSNIALPRKKYDAVLEAPVFAGVSGACTFPSEVSYNALAFNVKDEEKPERGKILAISHIVTYDYLWNEIRVKGGAYGCSMTSFDTLDIAFSSYRDPNVLNTYNAFKSIPEYLKNFKVDKESFKTFLIGAVSSYDRPLAIPSEIYRADICYLCGITKKYKVCVKKQITKTTVEDLKVTAKLLEKMLPNASVYTIGNEAKVKESELIKDIESM